jgi:hypothetical protein
MFLESLAKLTLIYEECKEKGIVIHSEEFMNETKKVIDAEIEVLQNDAKFFLTTPGPHVFGIGKLEVYIFPPELTQDGSWALATREAGSEVAMKEAYSFNTIAGFLEKLILVFKKIEDGSTPT